MITRNTNMSRTNDFYSIDRLLKFTKSRSKMPAKNRALIRLRLESMIRCLDGDQLNIRNVCDCWTKLLLNQPGAITHEGDFNERNSSVI